ncbi:hypothetical protein N7495_002191 [Penicillium taxi]|uniref:uncharacterized protein n=1 Tax=Penicillium taxi TaxID=168475 RepID=UPI00254518BA|nr:uncharacterized protein N7495_002191 [Penicillium taxi]KAJ5901663.1 hypothetical protein N7495_002191 [Penicillium taxi]
MARPTIVTSDAASDPSTRSTITLHVLVPALPPPNKFTFQDILLSSTVDQLRDRLKDEIPSHPPSFTQRLIYLGRSIDHLGTLAAVFHPVVSEEYTIHLALPPSLLDRSLSTPSRNSEIPVTQVPSVNLTNNTSASPDGPFVSPQPLRNALETHGHRLRPLFNTNPNDRTTRRSSISGDIAAPDAPSALDGHGVTDLPPAYSHLNLSRAQNLSQLLAHILQIESELAVGVLPTIESRLQLQTRVHECQLSMVSNPINHEFMQRISSIYRRIDDLSHPAGIHQFGLDPGRRYYLASGTNGTQSLIVPNESAANPDVLNLLTSLYPGRFNANLEPAPRRLEQNVFRAQPIPANQDLRQTIPAQQNVPQVPRQEIPAGQNVPRVIHARHRGRFNINEAIMRLMSRMWLFSQFMLIIYMASDSGTWTRTFMMLVFMIYALLQATGLSEQFQGAIIAPFQRFLERQALRPAAHPVQEARPANNSLGYVMESILLLLASLVPGIGEQRVQAHARLEAELEAERLRQEVENNQEIENRQAEPPEEEEQ